MNQTEEVKIVKKPEWSCPTCGGRDLSVGARTIAARYNWFCHSCYAYGTITEQQVQQGNYPHRDPAENVPPTRARTMKTKTGLDTAVLRITLPVEEFYAIIDKATANKEDPGALDQAVKEIQALARRKMN